MKFGLSIYCLIKKDAWTRKNDILLHLPLAVVYSRLGHAQIRLLLLAEGQVVFIGNSGVCPPLLKDRTFLPMPRAGRGEGGLVHSI